MLVSNRARSKFAPALAAVALLASAAYGDGGVTFHNIARDDVGLEYARTRSPEFDGVVEVEALSLDSPMTPNDLPFLSQMTGGYPGLAVWDYDSDGDLDLYVANGPGSANSLFQSQLAETGALTFVDVAASAGVAATGQDSAGVCFGDLDNDGDHDLVVLGRHDENRLFENRGAAADGTVTFRRVVASGVEGGTRWSASCALGDVDGDGLLDLFVANTAVDDSDSEWIFVEPFARNEHNQLFLNLGGLSFSDVSVASGMEDLAGITGGPSPTVTWSAAFVDVDLDGDADLVLADDQAAILPEVFGGIDRGLIHVLLNDGTGRFTDRPIVETPWRAGSWMGVAFGDLDCDGALDLYATNIGDYTLGSLGIQGTLGLFATRWFLGAGDGSFTDPGVGSLTASPFGWGTAIFDYDNDGDLDILSHGGLDVSHAVVADNPGTILQNQGCSADFVLDSAAIPEDPACVDADGLRIPGCTEHIRRNVRAVAIGDLDADGWNDVVTVANVVSAEPLPLEAAPDVFGSVFDRTAFFVPVIENLMAGNGVWNGMNPSPGDLAVELASRNGNGWAAVTVRGSIGLTSRGRVNRDGIGAVVSFTPAGGPTVTSPVTGGSSHLSQHSLERIFGLGPAAEGTVEVFWPGGVRNRLYGVRHGERLVFPEIPCSFDAEWPDWTGYVSCVKRSLSDLRQAGVLDKAAASRLLASALCALRAGRARVALKLCHPNHKSPRIKGHQLLLPELTFHPSPLAPQGREDKDVDLFPD